MNKVIKESFFEANIRIDEEFDNAQLAAQSNKPDFDKATVKVLDLKFDMSKIKTNNKPKEQDVRSKSYKGTERQGKGLGEKKK